MRKRTLTLTALLVLGGVMVGGMPLPAAETHAPTVEVKPVVPNAKPRSRDRVDFLAQYLNLTDEQKEKIRPIFAEETKKIGELRKETTLSAEDRRAKFQQIREETNAQLKKVLTEEQWEKYSKRGQRPVARPPGSPPPVRPAK